ncbi:hypothetical protein [Nocardia salmonicida]|uniref:hypothetical protein n=1 Tax=Nocardia salmonicida TaxID=53431 RepID=UPI00363BB2BC
MPRDSRPFIAITVDFPRHPKFAALTKGQKFLIVEAWCHCHEYLTDGVVDASTWRGLATKRDRDAVLRTGIVVEYRRGEIVENSTGFRPDSDEISSEFERTTGRSLPTDCVLFLSYLDHQQSRAEVESVREKRRSAGRLGGMAKARNASGTSDEGLASATAAAKQKPGKNVPEQEQQQVPTDVGTQREPRKRAHALPEGWEPPRDVIAAMHAEHPDIDLRTEHANFVDHWLSKGETRVDWTAAWRKWMRNAAKYARNRPRLRSVPGSTAHGGTENTLTPAEMKFARAEALKENPDPRILAAAGIPMPEHLDRPALAVVDDWHTAIAPAG